MEKIGKRDVGIFALALALRLLLFAYVVWITGRGVLDFYGPDARGYDQMAVNLLEHGILSESPGPPFEPALYRTPVYPVFLAAVYALFGHNVNGAVVIQFVLGAVMAVITAHLGERLFDDTVALIAGLIVAVDLLSMSLQLALMSETVFTFLLLVSFYWFVSYLRTQDRRQLVGSALVYGLAVLCRPVAQWFFLVIVGLMFFFYAERRTRALQASVIFVTIYGLTILPWIIRNHRINGVWALSSLIEIQLVTWAAAIEADVRGIVYPSNLHDYSEQLRRQAAARGLQRAEVLRFQRRVAWQTIKEHPAIALKLLVLGFIRMFSGVTGVGIWGYSDSGTGAASALVHGNVGEAFRRLFSQGAMRVMLLVTQYLVMLLIYAGDGLWPVAKPFRLSLARESDGVAGVTDHLFWLHFAWTECLLAAARAGDSIHRCHGGVWHQRISHTSPLLEGAMKAYAQKSF